MSTRSKTIRDNTLGYDFSGAAKLPRGREFKFRPLDDRMASLDASLARLFQYLTVETSGVLVHPQWKHFRHMEMMRNDQIRLSNGIWRSWHLQFQKGKKPLFCLFDAEVDTDSHKQPQAAVMEGKYWKRQTNAVASEYRKWRLYYKQRNKWSDIHLMPAPAIQNALTAAAAIRADSGIQQMDTLENARGSTIFQVLEDLLPDSAFALPRPGEGRGYMRPLFDCADILQQPNLEMLNPALDDLLDKLEPTEALLPLFNQQAYPNVTQQSFASPVTPKQSVEFFQPPETVSSDHQYRSDNSPVYDSTQQAQFISPVVQMRHNPEQISSQDHRYNIRQSGGFTVMQQEGYDSVSPSSFLRSPHSQKESTYPPTAMDISDPSIVSTFGPSSSIKMEAVVHNQAQGPYMPTGPAVFHPPSVPCPPSSSITRSASDPLFTGLSSASSSHHHRSTFPQRPSQVAMQHQQKSGFNSAQTQTSPPTSALWPQKPAPILPSPTPAAFQLQQQQLSTGKDSFSFSSPSPPQSQHGYSDMGVAEFWPSQQAFSQHKKASFDLQQASVTPPNPVYQSQQQSQPDKNELSYHLLAEQMQQLEREQFHQLREIEKQQNIATQRYLHLLQHYINHGATTTSEQQQQVLQSVLSDPTSVDILKLVLFQDGTEDRDRISSQSNFPVNVSGEDGKESVDQSNGALIQEQVSSDFMTQHNQKSVFSGSNPDTPTSSSVFTIPVSMTPPGPLSPNSQAQEAVLQKFKNARNLTPEEKRLYQEVRRQSHISAEQKRRGSIKNGFEKLQSLVVNPAAFPSGKVSKAVILEKAVDHLQHQLTEKKAREKRIEELKEEVRQLNESIAISQQQLPASGAPITRQRFEENRRLFREYQQQRIQQNYKFWIYSIILNQLFESYNTTVSTGSREDLCQTVLSWFEQNCNLPALRPLIMNSLRELCVKTSILSDPTKVPQQLTQQVSNT